MKTKYICWLIVLFSFIFSFSTTVNASSLLYFQTEGEATAFLVKYPDAKQSNNVVKTDLSKSEIQILKKQGTILFYESEKKKEVSAETPSLVNEQWGLKLIHVPSTLRKNNNLLLDKEIQDVNEGTSIKYTGQTFKTANKETKLKVAWENQKLSRLSITLDHVEKDWSVKVYNDGSLISEQKAGLKRANVLLPKKITYGNMVVVLSSFAGWNNTPSVENITAVNNARIAVIDSGINQHEDFCDNILTSQGRNYISSYDWPSDKLGHGTHIVGIIGACAYNNKGIDGAILNGAVDIIPFKVLDDFGNGSDFEISQAIEDAIKKDVDVINLSLAGSGETTILRESIQNALSHDIAVVAAAGNQNKDISTIFPASYPGVIAVTGITKTRAPLENSNKGWEIDISAPGENIYSTYGLNEYKSYSGTSVATPFVSSAAALIRTVNPDLDWLLVRDKLLSSAENFSTTYGLLNVEKAINMPTSLEKAEFLNIKNGQSLTEPKSIALAFTSNLINKKLLITKNGDIIKQQNITSQLVDITLPFLDDGLPNSVGLFVVDEEGTILTKNKRTLTSREKKMIPQDLDGAVWAKKEIQIGLEQGWIRGYNNGFFKPNDSLTRRHGVMMISRFLSLEPKSIDTPFNDVVLEQSGGLAVLSAYQHGVVKGYDHKFKPENTLTRAQMALILDRSLSLSEKSAFTFEDVPSSNFCFDAVSRLTKAGIITKQDKFRPYEPITRAQFSAMLYRASKL
ncbi:S8 family peptidase [Priestia endophytica]